MSSPAPLSEDNGNANGGVPLHPHQRLHQPPRLLRRLIPYFWVLGIFLVISGTAGAFLLSWFRIREPFTGPTATVKKEKLKVTIVERGTLESADYSDIICKIRAKGSTFASTIRWVVEDGTEVKPGDPLIELDDSGFQEQLKNKENDVNDAYAKMTEAKSNLIIVESQNDKDINTAEINKNLADADLTKYVGERAGAKLKKIQTQEGLRKYLAASYQDDVNTELALAGGKLTSEYLQAVNDIEGRIEMAISDRESWMDRAAWSMRMLKKGFYTPAQADADQSRLASADIALRKVKGELDVYRRFILERTVTDLWGKYTDADRMHKTILRQAGPKLEKARADDKARSAIYAQETARLADLVKEKDYYSITSPQYGMVVYYVPEQTRGGFGGRQSVIAQGESVGEGQKLIRIPNLKKMMVVARVHEAMIDKVKPEKTKQTGYSESLRLSFAVGRLDLWGSAAYQLGFDQIRQNNKEHFDEMDIQVTRPGQRASIRVDAFPGKTFKGTVKYKATVAAAAEFFSSDVKVYPTNVLIDEKDLDDAKGLKPGMSAEVTITAEEMHEPVLVIPIQSVVGNVAMGSSRKCYVLDDSGYPQERDIKVGKSNNELVEVVEGLKEGEKVVISPKALLPEKSDMKPGVSRGRGGAPAGDEGAVKKDSGKKKKDQK